MHDQAKCGRQPQPSWWDMISSIPYEVSKKPRAGCIKVIVWVQKSPSKMSKENSQQGSMESYKAQMSVFARNPPLLPPSPSRLKAWNGILATQHNGIKYRLVSCYSLLVPLSQESELSPHYIIWASACGGHLGLVLMFTITFIQPTFISCSPWHGSSVFRSFCITLSC